MTPTRLLGSGGVLGGLIAISMLFLSVANASEATAQRSDSLAARVARANLPSLVTIAALDDHDQPLSLGSGFFISRTGIVATNSYVVERATRLVLRWQGHLGSATRVVGFDPRYDLVTLQTSFTSTPAVTIGDSATVTVGEDVIALGSPQGLEGTVSAGIVSGIREIDGTRLLQITAPISPGSSGGPVFNSGGHVIGVATATLAKGQNLNFALPGNLLKQLSPTSISLREVKRSRIDTGQLDTPVDLIRITNVIERYDATMGARTMSGYSGLLSETLGTLTVSILNDSEYTIADPVILVIVRARNGHILNFHLNHLKDTVVPPRLAKQVSLTARAQGFAEFRNLHGRDEFLKGDYEIRVLDFRIVSRGGSAVEQLFDRK